jgi:DnaJ-class molecular chaperone
MRTGDVILSDKTSWCADVNGSSVVETVSMHVGGVAKRKVAARRVGEDEEEVDGGGEAPASVEGVNLRIAFKVCVEDHVMYARVHDDLVVVKRLTLAEALTGCTMLLPHPSRRQLRVSTPVGLVVTPGQRFTVEGGEWVGVVCVAWARVCSGRSATEPVWVV